MVKIIRCPKCHHKFKRKISPRALNFVITWIGTAILINIINKDTNFILGYNTGILSFFICFIITYLVIKWFPRQTKEIKHSLTKCKYKKLNGGIK